MWDVKRLDCYWKAIDLIVVFDEIVAGFPKFEEYELGSLKRMIYGVVGYVRKKDIRSV